MTTPGRSPQPFEGSLLRPIEERDLAVYNPDGYGIDPEDLDFDLDDNEISRGDRFRAWTGRQLIRLGWLGLAAGLAFGAAGIVAATSHPASGAAKPELTWSADKTLTDRLDASLRNLGRLQDDVDSLGDQTRKALAALSQVNQVALHAALDSGSDDLAGIKSTAAGLDDQLQCPAWAEMTDAELLKTYSTAVIDRYRKTCDAIASVAPLGADWDSLTSGSLTAMQVVDDINTHDSVGADALQLAAQGRYEEAVIKLNEADRSISDASDIAVKLAKVTSVPTLTEWLRRTKQFDDVLLLLWRTMIDSGGKVTPQVTAALKAVSDAKALLPNDTAVMQVVLYEMAGNLTANGLSIETAKGALSDAMAELAGEAVLAP
jgi:hypothetical protein